MDKRNSLSIVVPALNEEANLKEAVANIVATCHDAGIDWEIILVNDGSTDKSGYIANGLASIHSPRIKVLSHRCSMGIGCSVWDGIMASSKDAVTWLPGDGENDSAEIIKYLPLLEQVDIIVPFVLNKDVRSGTRQFLSNVFMRIINLSFGTIFHYTNGNIIYKRCVFDVVKQESKGFLFGTECLIKATRAGFTFAEVPVRICGRLKGRSKAISFRSLKVLIWEYLRLLFSVRILRRVTKPFVGDL